MMPIAIFLILLSLSQAGDCHAAAPTGYPIQDFRNYGSAGPAAYYVSPNGNDVAGDGSISSPWKTLGYALLHVSGGSVVYLRGGSYGDFRQLSIRGYAEWVTVKPYLDEHASFASFDISFDSRYYPTNFRLDGISIDAKAGSSSPFSLRYGKNIELRNIAINGAGKYQNDYGMKISNVENLLLYHSSVTNLLGGIVCSNSLNGSIVSNHIYGLGGSTGIAYSTGNANFIIARNNIHDSVWISGEAGAPIEPVHGSIVSIRSGDVSIEENIGHNLGSSSGLMTYTDTGTPLSYSNIHIDNNLFYDVANMYVIRLYRLGPDVDIRNNTIIGNLRTDKTPGVMQLGYTVIVHSLADGYDGSSFTVANNIMAGLSALPKTTNVKNNIMWSFYYIETPFSYLPNLDTNIVETANADNPLSYFTNGFFNGAVDLASGHGKEIDYSISAASPAYNFGSASLQMPGSLGNALGGFIENGGIARSADDHSAGAFEYGAATITNRADVNGSSSVTSADALLTMRYALGLSMAGTGWLGGTNAGDVNCDGKVGSSDALLILRYSLGLPMSGTAWCQ